LTDIKDLLARALPEQPPASSITRESAVARGRLRLRQRRAWFGAAGAGLSTVAIVVVVGLLPPAGPSGMGVGEPTATTGSPDDATPTGVPATPTVGPSPTPSGAAAATPNYTPTEPASKATTRLTAQLRAALDQVKPDATTRGVRGVYSVRQLGALEVIPSQGGYKAWAEIADSQGKGTIFIELDAGDPAGFTGGSWPTVCATPQNVGFTCEKRTDGATGALLIVEEGRHPGDTITEILVTIQKLDGTYAWVDLSNYSENDYPPGPNAKPRPERPTPPLTADQVIAMLLSPGITLFP
jgi:hypothetical protein